MVLTKKVKGLLIIGVILAIFVVGGCVYAYNTFGYSLTKTEAQAVAYSNAGVSKSDVNYSKVSKEREGLTATYDVDFGTATTDYSYTIDASSGSILERDAERNNFHISSSQASSDSSTSASNSTTLVTRDQAKTTALSDAGLEESAVTNLTVQTDIDNGISVFEVVFHDGAAGLEYDYTVNAETGEIIESSKDAIHD